MSADDNNPPPLESDDEQIESAQFTSSDTASAQATPSQAPSATPSNTPVVNMFSKVPQQSAQTKRSFEGEASAKAAPSGADEVQEMLNRLGVQGVPAKKAPGSGKNNADPEDEDDDDEDDDEDGGDEDDEDEEGEDEYVATKEQMDAVVPLLRENQLKIDALKAEYQKARRELEIKFQGLRAEHYKDRASIVTGQNDGTALPGFWLDTLQRSTLLAQFIEQHDEPALIFLDNITCEELTEDFGYKLVFYFAKNPFFTNETLTKTLKLANLYGADFQMPDIDESVGTAIQWLPEKNLTVKIEVKEVRQKGKGGKRGKPKEVRQEVPCPSFFQFFETRQEKSPEELEQMDDEEQRAYHNEWEMDYAIASTIRAKLIPDAALWYLGEASDSDDYDGEDDEDEDDDEEGDDEFDELDEDDADEDDEDEDVKPKAKKGGKGGAKGGKPLAAQGAGGKEGEPAPECKQQ